MHSHLKTKSIDSLVEDFDLSKVQTEEPSEKEPLTFWLPIEYKAKYDLIQERSNRKFGKILKEVLKKSIDKVKIEGEAS